MFIWSTNLFSHVNFVHLFIGQRLPHTLKSGHRSKVLITRTSREKTDTVRACVAQDFTFNSMLCWKRGIKLVCQQVWCSSLKLHEPETTSAFCRAVKYLKSRMMWKQTAVRSAVIGFKQWLQTLYESP